MTIIKTIFDRASSGLSFSADLERHLLTEESGSLPYGSCSLRKGEVGQCIRLINQDCRFSQDLDGGGCP